MDAQPDVARVATLLADRTRMAFLDEIAARGPKPIGVLARLAGVSPSVASQHVARLRKGGLVSVRPDGRHRVVALASEEVADALEALSRVAPPRQARGLRQIQQAEAFRIARACYDHLAGRLGVGVTAAMTARGWITTPPDGPALVLSGPGAASLAAFGLDLERLRKTRRAFARACMDWSERQPHLAGALGAAVLDSLIGRGWLARGEGRALVVREGGRRELAQWLGSDPLA